MKLKARSFILFAIACLCLGSNAFSADITFPDCVVKTVTGSPSADRFSCKVQDGSRLASLPIIVRINGIVAPVDKAASQKAARFVESHLTAANKITLKNVRMTGYCTVTADVYIDRVDLGRKLLEESLVDAKKLPKPKSIFEQVHKAVAPTPVEIQKVEVAKKYSDAEGGPIVFTPDMTLEDAFDMIAEAASPDLPLLIMWKDLQRNCFVDKDTSIGLQFSGPIKVETALKMLLRSINGQYFVGGGIITIASNRMKFPDRRVTRIYDIRPIIAAHVGNYGYGNGGYNSGYNSGFGNNSGNSYGNYGNNNSNFPNNSSSNTPFSTGNGYQQRPFNYSR